MKTPVYFISDVHLMLDSTSLEQKSALVDPVCYPKLQRIVQEMNEISVALNENLNDENKRVIFSNFPSTSVEHDDFSELIGENASEVPSNPANLELVQRVRNDITGIYNNLERRSLLNFKLENLVRFCQPTR